MDFIVNTQIVADFFNVARQTVNAWGRAGCPKLGRGKWNLKQVFDWWQENLADTHVGLGRSSIKTRIETRNIKAFKLNLRTKFRFED